VIIWLSSHEERKQAFNYMQKEKRIKILIITQKVDNKDPVLGFFHRWTEEFAKHAEYVTVIALGVGEYQLPKNVRVFSLGKERGVSRLGYIFNFYRFIWRERKNYDTVFVHMNPEYVVFGGICWRLWGKRVALWYTHKSVDLKLRAASLLTHTILTASKESFRHQSKKVHIVGHGIDTDFFSPNDNIKRESFLLSVGRLSPIKRHDLVIEIAAREGILLHIAGEGDERENLESLARRVGVNVVFLGALSHVQLRDEYRRAARFIHRSETGSLDKVVLEAAACGCPVDTTDPALVGLPLSPSYVREHHGLSSLIPRIFSFYETTRQ